MTLTLGALPDVMHRLRKLYTPDVTDFVQARLAKAALDPKHWVQVEIHEAGADFSVRIRAVDPALVSTETTSKVIE